MAARRYQQLAFDDLLTRGVRPEISYDLAWLSLFNEMACQRQDHDWYPLMSMFRSGAEDDAGAFWVALRDSDDAVCGVLAVRLRHLAGTLRQALEDGSYLTGAAGGGARCVGETTQDGMPLLNEDLDAVTGDIIIAGAGWARKSHRNLGLTRPTYCAAVAHALQLWPTVRHSTMLVQERFLTPFGMRQIGNTKAVGILRFHDPDGPAERAKVPHALLLESRQAILNEIDRQIGVHAPDAA
ncbi:hypothetical protein VPG91_11615 [Nitrospirillum amazonense]|uniref:hypothetical protein n=1 Tax=Nitrospirillum amazonense TaxID=28077 RepID=UPI002DD42F6F|nr:hypothetical protein [Nitrospirillum amazonense]MEC4591637.1 hypothetical protein [Nitrospirillum amazonense]